MSQASTYCSSQSAAPIRRSANPTTDVRSTAYHSRSWAPQWWENDLERLSTSASTRWVGEHLPSTTDSWSTRTQGSASTATASPPRPNSLDSAEPSSASSSETSWHSAAGNKAAASPALCSRRYYYNAALKAFNDSVASPCAHCQPEGGARCSFHNSGPAIAAGLELFLGRRALSTYNASFQDICAELRGRGASSSIVHPMLFFPADLQKMGDDGPFCPICGEVADVFGDYEVHSKFWGQTESIPCGARWLSGAGVVMTGDVFAAHVTEYRLQHKEYTSSDDWLMHWAQDACVVEDPENQSSGQASEENRQEACFVLPPRGDRAVKIVCPPD